MFFKKLHTYKGPNARIIFFHMAYSNNPLLSSNLCNHPVLSSIMIIYSDAVLSVSKCSPGLWGSAGSSTLSGLWCFTGENVCHLNLDSYTVQNCDRLAAAPVEETFGVPTCH